MAEGSLVRAGQDTATAIIRFGNRQTSRAAAYQPVPWPPRSFLCRQRRGSVFVFMKTRPGRTAVRAVRGGTTLVAAKAGAPETTVIVTDASTLPVTLVAVTVNSVAA